MANYLWGNGANLKKPEAFAPQWCKVIDGYALIRRMHQKVERALE